MTGMFLSLLGGGRAPIVTDPYFEYTTLLLPGNGTNGKNNNEFLDSSSNAFTVTRNPATGPNAPTQGTFSPFSQTGWGNYFTGSSALNATNALFNPSGAFTVEFWFYGTDSATSSQGLVSTWASGLSPAQGILIWKSGSNCEIQIGNASTGGTTIATFSWATYLNQWNHLALVRNSSNSCAVFLNGNRLTTPVTKSGSPGQTALTIGRAFPNSASSYFTGYISNARFVSGNNEYDPASSTITVPTTPLTAVPNTALLTCQANRFVDSSASPNTITLTGSPTVQAFSPFNPTASWSAATYGGSGYFDGSGDYLTVNDSGNNLDLGSGQFSVEFWWYPNSAAAGQYPLIGDSTGNWYIIWDNNAGTNAISLGRRGQGNDVNTTGFTLTTGNWQQVVVTRQSTGTNDTRIFVNGVLRGIGTSSQNYTITTTLGIGGTSTGTNVINGYLSSLRIVKGSVPSEYQTSNTTTGTQIFSPPTTPPTAVSGTSLLLNYTNAGIYDATSKNDLETVGNAQISTTQSKWGGSSMYFDGTGDYLYGPSNNLVNFGTGAFTIEGWVYALATPSDAGFFTNGGAATGSLGFYFLTGYLRFDIYGGGGFAATTLLPLNQWVHIACVRSGNTVTLYQNGTSVGSSTITDNNTSSLCYVGTKGWDLTKVFNGYMQDVRITKGYARYTGNFTAPTAAFPTL